MSLSRRYLGQLAATFGNYRSLEQIFGIGWAFGFMGGAGGSRARRNVERLLRAKKTIGEESMVRTHGCRLVIASVIASVIVWAPSAPARAQEQEPDHIRGQITEVTDSSIVVRIGDGETVRLNTEGGFTVIVLDKGSFTKVDFGSYVGAVAVKLDEYSPIVRDSLSWLHRGFELRIIEEELRGIAAGHKPWDLTPETIIAHGWVDDMEGRVISIKYGPTEQEETDVEVARDIPVLRMGLGDASMIKPGLLIFAGAQKNEDGIYQVFFIFVGKNGVVPTL